MPTNPEIYFLTMPLQYGGEAIPAGTRLTEIHRTETSVTFSPSNLIEDVNNIGPITVDINGRVHREIRRCSQ